jgi:valyl-tRNA synthetase
MPTQIPNAVGTTGYITTAIPYVNAPPHLGCALEVVQADALTRRYRQQGHNVRLQAGTDENSIKNVQAADAAGILVAALVQQNAAHFIALKKSLDLSPHQRRRAPPAWRRTNLACMLRQRRYLQAGLSRPVLHRLCAILQDGRTR